MESEWEYSDKLNVFKSVGPDEIHPTLYTEVAKTLSELLAIIS